MHNTKNDAISRDAVCDYIAEFVNNEYSTQAECDMVDYMIEGIQHLPSVTQKSGKWERHYIRPNVYKDLLWYCSACGIGCGYNNAFMFDYCPNCGAKMESENNG